MIKGIIFDLDGVITDTAKFHYFSWKKLCNEEELKFDKQLNEQLKGVSRKESLDIILDYNKISKEKLEKSEFLERKNNYYLQFLDKITTGDFLPGIENFLKKLKKSSIKIGLGSASKNAIPVLNKLDAVHFFDAIGDGNSVVNNKPAPDLFLYVAKELGLEAHECLVIEDAAPGVEAAHRAGMKAVGIGSKELLDKAECVLESTNLLGMEILKNI